jgi:hypothetical protein
MPKKTEVPVLLLLYAPGTRVRFKQDGQIGVVLEALIGDNQQVSYRVAWWQAGVRNNEMVAEFEITLDQLEKPPLQIGFH